MRANEQFFEDLRNEINNSVTSIDTQLNDDSVSRIFADCGWNLKDEKVKNAIAVFESIIDEKEAKIEYLESQLRTASSEKTAINNSLNKLNVIHEAYDCIEGQNKIEKTMSQTNADGFNEIMQKLEDAEQRESELRNAVDELKKQQQMSGNVERLPMEKFLEYAEDFPSTQNKEAKTIKEALISLYDIKRISTEDLDRWKKLGMKETPVMAVNANEGSLVQVTQDAIYNK